MLEDVPASPPQQVTLAGPARFFSVDGSTAGGAATVERINEGSLRLSTHGGAISVGRAKVGRTPHRGRGDQAAGGSVYGPPHLGDSDGQGDVPPAQAGRAEVPLASSCCCRRRHCRCNCPVASCSRALDQPPPALLRPPRLQPTPSPPFFFFCCRHCPQAVEAWLDSGGGPISGSISAFDVSLASGGGRVQLQRLEGRKADVQSGGGPLEITAAFGDEINLNSGGGAVHLGSINCQEGRAEVLSGGGAVEVGGVDGSVAVRSSGGAVSLQLNDRAGEVFVESEGGDIHVFISPTLIGRLQVLRCGSLDTVGSSRLASADDGGSRGASGSGLSWHGNRMTPPAHAQVILDAGGQEGACMQHGKAAWGALRGGGACTRQTACPPR